LSSAFSRWRSTRGAGKDQEYVSAADRGLFHDGLPPAAGEGEELAPLLIAELRRGRLLRGDVDRVAASEDLVLLAGRHGIEDPVDAGSAAGWRVGGNSAHFDPHVSNYVELTEFGEAPMRRTVTALITSGMLLGGLSVPAQAAEDRIDMPRKQAVEALLEKADSEIARANLMKEDKRWKVSSKEFKEARAKARKAQAKSGQTNKNLKKVQKFTRQAVEHGKAYRTENVEVISLLDGDVER
jgi:hypothetical protein